MPRSLHQSSHLYAPRGLARLRWAGRAAALVAGLIGAQAYAVAADSPSGNPAPGAASDKIPENVRQAVRRIGDAVALPAGQGVKAVSVAGRLFFVSGNGRLIIEGAAHDAWTGNQIVTAKDARRMANFIEFDKMKVSVSDLAPLSFGKAASDKRVVIATDPNCPQCRKLLNDIRAESQLAKEMRFDILLIPKDQASGQEVRRYFCTADQKKALQALFAGKPSDLPTADGECAGDELSLRKRIATMYLLGLRKVPTVIAPNGRIHTGVPTDLSEFIRNNL